MYKCALKTIESPSQEQIALIGRPLKQYNESRVGSYRRKEFAIYAYDPKGKLIGGIYSWLVWGWLYIDYLWVDDSCRGRGAGSQLLTACEQFAIENRVFHARLNTGSFQAPDFYKKNGYEIFAQLDIIAPDNSPHVDYFMKKDLKSF